MTDNIDVTTKDGVATIWLDRPEKRNALTYEMWVAMGDIAQSLAADHAVRVVVLRGRGGHFCAGADVASVGEPGYYDTNRRAEESLAAIPKPTIAFITGSCVGGGAQLALACDLRIADTTLLAGITPARLGIVYPAHSIERTVRVLGPSATKHLLFSAELIDADRALRIGFVDELHDPADAESRLDAFTSLLVSKRSALTQQASKAMVDAAAAGGITPDVLDVWNAASENNPDVLEGVAAFMEKRDPSFSWNGLD